MLALPPNLAFVVVGMENNDCSGRRLGEISIARDHTKKPRRVLLYVKVKTTTSTPSTQIFAA
jgi:hypothetical protein